ncbi:MAG: fluoride efflux transporter CrcB [Anaerolineales bacterium]
MQKYLYLSLGAILGASARYWVGGWAAGRLGSDFSYGTLLVNLSGSFLLGVFLALTRRFLIAPEVRVFIAVGFFGSFTTFSSYTNESINLLLEGQPALGLLNLMGGALLGALAAWMGVLLGKTL